MLIGSPLRPAGTGGIKTTTWQKVNQAWKQTVRYRIKSFYIPPFQFLFAARLTQTHLQRTRLLTSFMSACPSTQALSQTFTVKLFDLIKKKKLKKNLNLQPLSENSLSEELERDICPRQSALQMTSERQSTVCVSECEGWGYLRVVPTRVSSSALYWRWKKQKPWSHYSPMNSH